MDFGTSLVLITLICAALGSYGIFAVSRARKQDRQFKHEEFKEALEPTHREKMASIGAHRDEEIAKATKKEPPPTIEHRQIEN